MSNRGSCDGFRQCFLELAPIVHGCAGRSQSGCADRFQSGFVAAGPVDVELGPWLVAQLQLAVVGLVGAHMGAAAFDSGPFLVIANEGQVILKK